MKFNFSAMASHICAACLAFLGYSCGDNNEDMYGCPVGEWEIKGNVTDEAGQIVSKATVKVTLPELDSGLYPIEETKLDDEGNYIIESGGIPDDSYKVVCIPDNQALSADSTIVKLHYVRDKKHRKNPWYVGSAKATVDFMLKTNKKAETNTEEH
ncbi:MAG: radical SAM-associated putative lipoprotein [Muribaculaceae bacterium]|nr:radical SAM-associated putative lipoprotein [Muribaculaceae bacterium]MDE6768869.1 radical SAM-associated putative lipoprotein [Muribaculaceae bacterium]